MMLYVILSCLVCLLLLRFVYLARDKEIVKVVTTNFGNKHQKPLILKKENECLIIVTDPVGTPRVGESACLIAKGVITKQYESSLVNVSPADFLKKTCFLAHRAISEQMNANNGGCSLALIYLHQKQLSYASVGDIGIYLSDDELKQLNSFDLYKYQLRSRVLEGQISEESLLNNQLRNELTAYLGHENLKKINISTAPIQLVKHDQLFVATRAVYESITLLNLERLVIGKGKPSFKIEVLERWYHGKKLANEQKQRAASAVLISHFK